MTSELPDLRSGLVPVEQQSSPTPPPSREPIPEPVQATPWEWAWAIIANTSEGNWNRESQPWQAKAREWADTYCGEPFPDKEMPVAMGRALALVTRVNPEQTTEWRGAVAVWCRRHDTELHRTHMYPFTVLPLYADAKAQYDGIVQNAEDTYLASTRRAGMVDGEGRREPSSAG